MIKKVLLIASIFVSINLSAMSDEEIKFTEQDKISYQKLTVDTADADNLLPMPIVIHQKSLITEKQKAYNELLDSLPKYYEPEDYRNYYIKDLNDFCDLCSKYKCYFAFAKVLRLIPKNSTSFIVSFKNEAYEKFLSELYDGLGKQNMGFCGTSLHFVYRGAIAPYSQGCNDRFIEKLIQYLEILGNI